MKERTPNSIDFYKRECKKYPPLSYSKQMALFQRLGEGDTSVRETLFLHNFRLVLKIVLGFQQTTFLYDDLLQEGGMALFSCIDAYDLNRGVRFSSYAVPQIRGRLLTYIASNSTLLTYDRGFRNLVSKYEKLQKEFLKVNGREATRKEMMELLNIPLKRLLYLEENFYHEVSLNSKIDEETSHETGDFFVGPGHSLEEIYEQKDMEEILHSILFSGVLSEKEKEALLMRYGFKEGKCYTFEEIGAHLHMTKQGAQYILRHGLEKIRKEEYRKKLVDYVEDAKEKSISLRRA